MGIVIATVALVLGVAPTAQAHAALLFATPTIDGAVPTSPPRIQLVFDQPVTTSSGTPITITDDNERPAQVGSPRLPHGRRTVVVQVRQTLSAGSYTVHWAVTASDGDAVTGDYRFAVGSSAGLAPAEQTAATQGTLTTVLLRWGLFFGLALMIGGVAGRRLARRTATSQARNLDPPPWLAAGAGLSVAAATGLAVLLAGSGSLLNGLTHLTITRFTSSAPGRVAGIEVLAAVTALVALRMRRIRWGTGAALVILVAEGWRAHPHTTWPLWGTLTVAGHLLAAAVWVGALVHVIRVATARRRRGDPSGSLVRRYAALAVWLFLAIAVTGVLNGLAVIEPSQLVTALRDTSYGHWLLVKLGAVSAVVVLALLARRHLLRSPHRPQPSTAARFEVVLLVAILAISATLTALPPPIDPNAPLPFPPPAVGPVVAAGGRAGFIGAGVSASNGQLLVQLTAPDAGGPPDQFELAGHIETTRGANQGRLKFRPCGAGCFVAPTRWTPGEHTLTLQITSTPFDGGTTAIPIAWPPRPRPALLRKIATTMAAVKTVTVHEQTTSNTNRPPPAPDVLSLTGEEYLDADLFGSGKAPNVNLVDRTGDEMTLSLGYPGDKTYIRLTVDKRFRVIRELLAGPQHLITRTFVYPETH